MSDFEVFVGVEVGIIASLLIPWARSVLARARTLAQGRSGEQVGWWTLFFIKAWQTTKPYLYYLFASSVVAFILLMAARWQKWEINDFYQCFFWGFFSDTILAKLLREGQQPVTG